MSNSISWSLAGRSFLATVTAMTVLTHADAVKAVDIEKFVRLAAQIKCAEQLNLRGTGRYNLCVRIAKRSVAMVRNPNRKTIQAWVNVTASDRSCRIARWLFLRTGFPYRPVLETIGRAANYPITTQRYNCSKYSPPSPPSPVPPKVPPGFDKYQAAFNYVQKKMKIITSSSLRMRPKDPDASYIHLYVFGKLGRNQEYVSRGEWALRHDGSKCEIVSHEDPEQVVWGNNDYVQRFDRSNVAECTIRNGVVLAIKFRTSINPRKDGDSLYYADHEWVRHTQNEFRGISLDSNLLPGETSATLRR